MHTLAGATCAIMLICSAPSWAASPSNVVPVADSQDLEATAEKTCNDALDHDRFNYSTMEECVSDTVVKLKRTRASGTSRSAEAKAPHSN